MIVAHVQAVIMPCSCRFNLGRVMKNYPDTTLLAESLSRQAESIFVWTLGNRYGHYTNWGRIGLLHIRYLRTSRLHEASTRIESFEVSVIKQGAGIVMQWSFSNVQTCFARLVQFKNLIIELAKRAKGGCYKKWTIGSDVPWIGHAIKRNNVY